MKNLMLACCSALLLGFAVLCAPTQASAQSTTYAELESGQKLAATQFSGDFAHSNDTVYSEGSRCHWQKHRGQPRVRMCGHYKPFNVQHGSSWAEMIVPPVISGAFDVLAAHVGKPEINNSQSQSQGQWQAQFQHQSQRQYNHHHHGH